MSLLFLLAATSVVPAQGLIVRSHGTSRNIAPFAAQLESSEIRLSKLPRGINQYEVASGVRLNPLATVSELARLGLSRARAEGVSLLEIEFPALLGTKTEFDDVDNVQILNANSNWAMEFAAPLAAEEGPSLWLAFADRRELQLAREAWPGRAFAAATLSTIEDSAAALGGRVEQPWGSAFARAVESVTGADLLGAKPDTATAPAPSVVIAVQPGDGGPLEDWLNLESCEGEGATLVSVNGALDKLRGGAYPRLLFPKLAECVDRFYARFDAAFFLKPYSDKGKSGWIFRVYGEPWQVLEQTRDDTRLLSVTEARPTFAQVSDLLRRADSIATLKAP